MPWEYEGKDTANIPIGEQDTSHVAGEVLAEQQGEDIFKPPTPAEVVKLRKRLDDLRQECSELYADLYPMTKPGLPMNRPKYQVEQEIRDKLRELEKEQSSIQGYLSLVYDGFDTSDMARVYPSY